MNHSEYSSEIIDLSGPDLTEIEIEAVVQVLRTRHLSLGPKLAEFEQQLANYAGRKHGIAVNSGTSALHLLVRALDIGEGDEVITTPFSFIASANCLLYERATPRFVDIDPVTLNIDCTAIEKAITPKTRAILAVDAFGLPADWHRLEAIAHDHNIALIEDSCEALGARRKMPNGMWRRAGNFGDAGTFAFYPNKQVTTGEGGMIVTDRTDIAALCRSLRNQGRDEGTEWLTHARLGYNYRLSDINCALGIAQMSRLSEILEVRRRVAGWYDELLSELEGVLPLAEDPDSERSWFVYVVRLVESSSPSELQRVILDLRERGVVASNYFSPIHLQPFYRQRFGFQEGDFPIAERASVQCLALPFHNRITRTQVERVVNVLRDVLVKANFSSATASSEARK